MKSILGRWVALAAVMSLITGVFTGCAWSVGEKKGEVYSKPTQGQELLDLKRARDQGALSEDEYQTQKRRILGH